jgi:hypothetical protein
MISQKDYNNTITLANLRSAYTILTDSHRPSDPVLRDKYHDILDAIMMLKNKVWDYVEVEENA